MASKTYTAEEKAAYKAGLAAAKKKGGAAPKRTRRTTTPKGRKGKAGSGRTRSKSAKRASGCIYYNSYKGADGSTVNSPKIWAWRYYGSGANRKKMEMTCYLSKNDGKAKTGTSTDVGRVFVCNIVIVGETESKATGWWSEQYEKLTISSLGLVANPKLSGGGYFGRGGSRYKDKVK